jgi:hypothetical protein
MHTKINNFSDNFLVIKTDVAAFEDSLRCHSKKTAWLRLLSDFFRIGKILETVRSPIQRILLLDLHNIHKISAVQ